MNQMKVFKPLVKVSGKGMTIVFMAAGILMMLLGVYVGFFRSSGYVKSTGVITHLEEDIDVENGNTIYIPTVTYTVDGREYTLIIGSRDNANQMGKEVKIKYDPANPAKANEDSPGLVVYLIGVGAVFVAAALFTLWKNKKQLKQLNQQPSQALFGMSQPGSVVRKLYFVTDQGTAKGTCHIEDADRNVLYEAVSKKFSLLADSEMEFVDHVYNRRTTHFIGKTVTSSSDAIWVLDNHSTFSVDGRDVWKQLHENGIRIQTGLNGLKWAYTIYRDEVEIARVVNTNKLVHEEDAEAKGPLAKVPFPGFFRIETNEENLDAIFLTLFAIGRTDMMFYD